MFINILVYFTERDDVKAGLGVFEVLLSAASREVRRAALLPLADTAFH